MDNAEEVYVDEIIVTGTRDGTKLSDGGSGGLWLGFWTTPTQSSDYFSFGGGSVAPTTDEGEEEEETDNEIVVERERPSDDESQDTTPTYGEFISAFFDYLDSLDRPSEGDDGYEASTDPANVEYDLSIDVEGESATVTVYDRWNETASTYSYGNDGSYYVFDAPLDNSDFTRNGQQSVLAPTLSDGDELF